MIRLAVILCITLIQANIGKGQSNIDSLKSIVLNEPSDTIKVMAYLTLHEALATSDTIQSRDFLNKAVLLSEKTDNRKIMCLSYLKQSTYFRNKGQLKKAKITLGRVDANRSYFEDPNINASYYMEYGLINFVEGTYDTATINFLKALRIYEQLNNVEEMAECYKSIGSTYWQLEKLDNALDYFLKGLDLLERNSRKEKTSGFLGNIGLIYRAKNEYEKAMQYYERSLEMDQLNGDKLSAAINLQNIGVLYKRMGNYDAALKHLVQSNNLSREIDDQVGVLYTNHGIATIYGEYGQFDKAAAGLEEALVMAKEMNIKEEIKNLYESLSDMHEKMGRYKTAYDYRKNFELWKDSIGSEIFLNQIKELEVRYETEKKDKQIVLLAKEKELQEKEVERQSTMNKAIIGSSLLLIILAGVTTYTFIQRLRNQKIVTTKNEEIKNENFKRQLSELEMKALRSQINPHFLFNCMNSINRMILNGDNETASVYLTKFSKLIRRILENTETNRVSLENELALLESYIEMEELRFKGKIDYEISVDKTIEVENTYLPPMVLQPFVENAIWHGLMHKEQDTQGCIKISVKEMEDTLVCMIEDNGVGRVKSQKLRDKSLLKTKSLGMKITEERLKLLSKQHIAELIRIVDLKDPSDEAAGTRVEINIPLT